MTEIKNYCNNCKHWINEFVSEGVGFKLHLKFGKGNNTAVDNKGLCISEKRSDARKTTDEITPHNYTCFYHEKKTV